MVTIRASKKLGLGGQNRLFYLAQLFLVLGEIGTKQQINRKSQNCACCYNQNRPEPVKGVVCSGVYIYPSPSDNSRPKSEYITHEQCDCQAIRNKGNYVSSHIF